MKEKDLAELTALLGGGDDDLDSMIDVYIEVAKTVGLKVDEHRDDIAGFMGTICDLVSLFYEVVYGDPSFAKKHAAAKRQMFLELRNVGFDQDQAMILLLDQSTQFEKLANRLGKK